MTKVPLNGPMTELKGSEQHHDLKNQPGEEGDPTHAETSRPVSEDLKAAIRQGEPDTEIAAALKGAVEKN